MSECGQICMGQWGGLWPVLQDDVKTETSLGQGSAQVHVINISDDTVASNCTTDVAVA